MKVALSDRVHALSHSADGVRLLQRAGVDYVVSLDGRAFGGVLEPVLEQASVYDGPVHLLRVPDPLPKAYVVPRARVVADGGQAVRLLEDRRHDVRREVIVSHLPPGPSPATEDGAFTASVRDLWHRPDAWALEVRASAPGYLVVLDGYDDAWQAAVDGAPAPTLRANLMFRAVPVPAGAHRVEMRYRPASLRWGALASAGGALAAAALVVWSGRLR
jgi:hypothetical protein